jgi:hypothetical protein
MLSQKIALEAPRAKAQSGHEIVPYGTFRRPDSSLSVVGINLPYRRQDVPIVPKEQPIWAHIVST